MPTFQRRYGRGFLLGRLRAYERGSLTIGNVAGAIRLAKDSTIEDDEISAMLNQFGLQWDTAKGAIIDTITRIPRRISG